jgi:hypothetical protein
LPLGGETRGYLLAAGPHSAVAPADAPADAKDGKVVKPAAAETAGMGLMAGLSFAAAAVG